MNPVIRSKKILNPENVLFITAVVGSILYISLIFNDNLWVDEAFTASLIRGSWSEVIRDTFSDTLPPFYNFAGKALTSVFGFSSVILKFFSCFPMILLIFFGGRQVSVYHGFRPAFLYQLFLIAMPSFLHYAVEIRMYSWGIFSVGMAGIFFAGILNDRETYPGFTLFTVFSGYIHHFALVSCGMMWLILIIVKLFSKDKAGLKRIFKYLALCIFLYLPCLVLAVKQIMSASSYFSMTPLSLRTFISDVRFPFVTEVTWLSALLLLFTLSAVTTGLISIKNMENSGAEKTGLLLITAFYLTLLFGYGVSFIAGRSIFTARYLVPGLSLFWLGAALLLDRMLIRFGEKTVLAGLIAAVTLVTAVTLYTRAFREEYAPGVENMKAFFGENIGKGDKYIIHEDYPEIEICMRYYCPELRKTSFENPGETSGRIWLFTKDEPEKELDNALKHGYNPIYMGDFTFDRYSFSVYGLEKR